MLVAKNQYKIFNTRFTFINWIHVWGKVPVAVWGNMPELYTTAKSYNT